MRVYGNLKVPEANDGARFYINILNNNKNQQIIFSTPPSNNTNKTLQLNNENSPYHTNRSMTKSKSNSNDLESIVVSDHGMFTFT